MGVFDLFFDLTACLFAHNEDKVPHSIPTSSSHDGHPTPALPLEIVVSILEAAHIDSDAERTLGACSLVCKDWLAPAQKILYRRVTLTSDPAAVGFVTATSGSTPRSRALAEAVTSLRVIIDDNQPHHVSHSALAQAVLQCPNLDALSLAVYHDSCDPAKGQYQGLSRLFSTDIQSMPATRPRITTLRFDNWTDNASALVDLLEAFPSVTSLTISGTPPALPESATAPPCAIQELRIDCQPSLESIKWLLHDSPLRVLDFMREPECELLTCLLLDHHETLEFLALPSCASAEYSLALEQCTRLRDLRIEDLWTAQNAKRQLPPSLEHFAFSLGKRSALEPVIAAVKSNAPLKTVTMHMWSEDEQHPRLADLHIACALQGVELNVVRDIKAFRKL